jgi:hypothetical protein
MTCIIFTLSSWLCHDAAFGDITKLQMASSKTDLYARPVIGFMYSLVHTCQVSCNEQSIVQTRTSQNPAAWQPCGSRGPQNTQILKSVATSFGLDSILLTDVAILEPIQRDTEITLLITATPPPPPTGLFTPLVTVQNDTGIYISCNTMVRSLNVYTSSVILTASQHSTRRERLYGDLMSPTSIKRTSVFMYGARFEENSYSLYIF